MIPVTESGFIFFQGIKQSAVLLHQQTGSRELLYQEKQNGLQKHIYLQVLEGHNRED